ncbi:Cutinase [Saccharopolyspora antimicrobica]|uniref:Cutinase n=1 Tax=Saccharopolyspora antimicrobica TaxID=455193 RepID=A0A1I5CF55_9PSEU|nr:cutinase family protein [Saccharopolyspora antimicrobica]RKT88873.1 Cutinase [Saccharopolyspora antimicrobica]SFN85675.1 Cutinase [Saccharopolyspora antimicrobica]
MRFAKKAWLALSGAALVAAGLSGVEVAAAAPPQSTGCGDLYVLTDGRGRGLTGRTWDDAGTTVPAGARMEKFLYDDGIVPGVHPHSLDNTRRVAAPALERKVVDFHRACPGSRITLVGYSFGALISGDAAELLAARDEVPDHLVNAVLIADPRRHVTNTTVQGPSGGIMSVAPDGPGMHTPGPREFGDIEVASICREDDVVCHAANPVSNAVAFSAQLQRLSTAHGAYGSPEQNFWARPADFAGVGDLLLPPSAPIAWGPPAFAAPMPREILNDNAAYQRMMDGLTESGGALAWAEVLNSFGLPGDEIVHGFWKALQEAGAGY